MKKNSRKKRSNNSFPTSNKEHDFQLGKRRLYFILGLVIVSLLIAFYNMHLS